MNPTNLSASFKSPVKFSKLAFEVSFLAGEQVAIPLEVY
jgi:hypothetical protein